MRVAVVSLPDKKKDLWDYFSLTGFFTDRQKL
jgi:hypothetical protein